jgi:RimJ/RimL family protein N-acetyltransferase
MTPSIETPLFQGPNVRLSAFDPEKDAATEALWTGDLDYTGLLRSQPIRPMLPSELKKLREEQEKKSSEKDDLFNFALRRREDDHLIGFACIRNVMWSHNNGQLVIAIGDPEAGGRYEKEALGLMLTYGFEELGLHALRVILPEYQHELVGLLDESGFHLDVRQRQMAYRHGRFWDLLVMSILRKEWEAKRSGVAL